MIFSVAVRMTVTWVNLVMDMDGGDMTVGLRNQTFHNERRPWTFGNDPDLMLIRELDILGIAQRCR